MIPALQWFGPRWDSGVCESCERARAPVGVPCAWCEETITIQDNGVLLPEASRRGFAAFHRACFIRQIAGSVAHQMKTCRCHGGTEDDPPGLTMREAAEAAEVWWEGKMRPEG